MRRLPETEAEGLDFVTEPVAFWWSAAAVELASNESSESSEVKLRTTKQTESNEVSWIVRRVWAGHLPKKTTTAMMIKMTATRRIHHQRDLRLVRAALSGSAAARTLRCDLDNLSGTGGLAA